MNGIVPARAGRNWITLDTANLWGVLGVPHWAGRLENVELRKPVGPLGQEWRGSARTMTSAEAMSLVAQGRREEIEAWCAISLKPEPVLLCEFDFVGAAARIVRAAQCDVSLREAGGEASKMLTMAFEAGREYELQRLLEGRHG